jgi:hypothetical protein
LNDHNDQWGQAIDHTRETRDLVTDHKAQVIDHTRETRDLVIDHMVMAQVIDHTKETRDLVTDQAAPAWSDRTNRTRKLEACRNLLQSRKWR